MSLFEGDLTTPALVATWLPNPPTLPSPIISQLITSMSQLITAKLNRRILRNGPTTDVFDGVGNMQLVLRKWPVTSITSVQQGQQLIPPSDSINNPGYGYRCILGGLGSLPPGHQSVLEFVGGYFYTKPQNVTVHYMAGYLGGGLPLLIPDDPFQVTVGQELGVWCSDNGVSYLDGTLLTPVKPPNVPTTGQYLIPTDANPGLYTFSAGDMGKMVVINYSFVPAALTEACNQMVAERLSYRNRIGEISKSLGGQETIRYMRGGSRPWNNSNSLPPEVMDLINDYIDVLPPLIGAPL